MQIVTIVLTELISEIRTGNTMAAIVKGYLTVTQPLKENMVRTIARALSLEKNSVVELIRAARSWLEIIVTVKSARLKDQAETVKSVRLKDQVRTENKDLISNRIDAASKGVIPLRVGTEVRVLSMALTMVAERNSTATVASPVVQPRGAKVVMGVGELKEVVVGADKANGK